MQRYQFRTGKTCANVFIYCPFKKNAKVWVKTGNDQNEQKASCSLLFELSAISILTLTRKFGTSHLLVELKPMLSQHRELNCGPKFIL